MGIYLEIFADADYEPSKATDRRYVSSGAIVCVEVYRHVIVGFPGHYTF